MNLQRNILIAGIAILNKGALKSVRGQYSTMNTGDGETVYNSKAT